MLKNSSFLRILTLGWFIFMTVLSHMSGERSGEESSWLARITGLDEMFLRSAAHVGLFLVFGFLVCVTFQGSLPWLIAVLIWCVLDEVTKIPIPGRHFSWFDSGLNAIGAVIGIVVGVISG